VTLIAALSRRSLLSVLVTAASALLNRALWA
jgi:hypothetical protein